MNTADLQPLIEFYKDLENQQLEKRDLRMKMFKLGNEIVALEHEEKLSKEQTFDLCRFLVEYSAMCLLYATMTK